MVSRVAITDEALLAEANRQSLSMPSFSGPSTPELWVQDGSLELQGKIAKGTLVSKVRTKEVDPLRDADLGGVVEGEDFASLPRGFVELSNCLGILVLGFEKEINSLLRKLEAKKGCGVKASGGRQHSLSSSRLEKEIRRLKCSVNYNSVPSMVKGKGRGGCGVSGRGSLLAIGDSARRSLFILGRVFLFFSFFGFSLGGFQPLWALGVGGKVGFNLSLFFSCLPYGPYLYAPCVFCCAFCKLF